MSYIVPLGLGLLIKSALQAVSRRDQLAKKPVRGKGGKGRGRGNKGKGGSGKGGNGKNKSKAKHAVEVEHGQDHQKPEKKWEETGGDQDWEDWGDDQDWEDWGDDQGREDWGDDQGWEDWGEGEDMSHVKKTRSKPTEAGAKPAASKSKVYTPKVIKPASKSKTAPKSKAKHTACKSKARPKGFPSGSSSSGKVKVNSRLQPYVRKEGNNFNESKIDAIMDFVSSVDYQNLELDDLKADLKYKLPQLHKTRLNKYFTRRACGVTFGKRDVKTLSIPVHMEGTENMKSVVAIGAALQLVTL